MSNIADLLTPGARNTRGRVPIYQVTLNNEPLDITIHEFALSCAEGNHDAGSLRAQSTELEDTKGFVNGLISFRYGTAPHTEQFVGYIVDVKEEQASQGALTFTLSLMGTTKVLFEGMPHYWVNKSATAAIRDTVHRNGLGYTGHPHTFLWKAIAQTQESDWAFISTMAKRLGFSLFNRYGIVMAYNPTDLFNKSGSYARLVASADRDVAVDRTLIEFEPSEISDVVERNLGTKYGYFTTGNVAQMGTQPGKFRGYMFDPRPTIRDQEEGAEYLRAVDVNMDGWKQHAIARIHGDADIYPGHCVEVTTTNRRFLKDKYDGKWMVRATQQSMDRQQYQTLLYLNRPESRSVQTPAYRPFWQTEGTGGRAKPVMIYEPRSADQGGVWVSSWNDRTLRSIL